MWQEKYDHERYECPICEIPVTENDYDWIRGRCKQCVIMEDVRNEQRHQKFVDNIKTLKEKAEKYDELQKLWWWLDRRTHDGVTPTSAIRYFLNDAKKYFEPHKEDK